MTNQTWNGLCGRRRERDLEAIVSVGRTELAKQAMQGDAQARRAILYLARRSEERRSALLVSWGIDLDNLDCLGEVQYA